MKKPLIFHPFLFAVFPILFLYAHNVAEVSAAQILVPILISVLAAFLFWVLMSLILRDRVKAGLATTLAVFLFFSYGRFYDLLGTWDITQPRHDQLLLGLVLLFGYLVYFLKIAGRDFRGTTRLLNVVALALIIVNVVTIAPWHAKEGTISGEEGGLGGGVADTVDLEMPDNPPDIYYIILDEYASPRTMARFYNFDNSEFVDSLTNKGFFIAGDSKTEVKYTYNVIASRLNMGYISTTEPWNDIIREKLTNSSAVKALRASGYTYVYFGTMWELGSFKMEADQYYNFYDSGGTTLSPEFTHMLLETTMMSPFCERAYQGYYRNGALETFEALKRMPEVDSPKFVFAHIMIPHDPFIFGPEGQAVEPRDYYNWADKEFYLGQYKFVTREIEKVIDAILEHSSNPPVIIVQSDHGPRTSLDRSLDIPNDEWQWIFNAYYLPGFPMERLNDSISPVNTFPLIFDYYFGASFELPDG